MEVPALALLWQQICSPDEERCQRTGNSESRAVEMLDEGTTPAARIEAPAELVLDMELLRLRFRR